MIGKAMLKPFAKALTFYDTNRCGVQEIDNLSSHGHNAEAAMVDFCHKVFENPVKFRSSTARPNTLYCFYLFSAAVFERDRGVTYGSKLADYITLHGLGDVVATKAKQNEGFHSDHSNQAWLWSPDRAALLAWWDKWKAANTEPEAPQQVVETKSAIGLAALVDQPVVGPVNPMWDQAKTATQYAQQLYVGEGFQKIQVAAFPQNLVEAMNKLIAEDDDELDEDYDDDDDEDDDEGW